MPLLCISPSSPDIRRSSRTIRRSAVSKFLGSRFRRKCSGDPWICGGGGSGICGGWGGGCVDGGEGGMCCSPTVLRR